jgi:hypothetical protein
VRNELGKLGITFSIEVYKGRHYEALVVDHGSNDGCSGVCCWSFDAF